MKNHLLLFPLLLLSHILPAQLVFSTASQRNGVGNDAFDVAEWGEQYLIRTSNESILPYKYYDDFLFAEADGISFYFDSFNPYVRESDITTTDFAVLTDSTAVSLAADSGDVPRVRLTRFNKIRDTLQIRDFNDLSVSPYSLCFASDSVLFFVELPGNDDFIVRSFTGDFDDRYSVPFSEEAAELNFHTAYADVTGNLWVAYERVRIIDGNRVGADQLVAQLAPDGTLAAERSVAGLRRVGLINDGYTHVRPIGQNGIAILEGLSTPDLGCVTSTCEDEGGYLHIYRDQSSPREFYKLDFSPFGMELLPDGNLFVYGATSVFGDDGKGVLFNPTGWPDGNRIHVLNDPYATGQEPIAYNRIYGMDVAANGDLIGTGVIAYGETNRVEESHWLFRMGPGGCFTADCSDLAEDPGNLVPVINLTSDLTINTYPNPFTFQLNFLPAENQTGVPVMVSLRDVTGRLVREGKLGNGLEWSTVDLAPGLYLATFVSGAQRGTVKVVKR